MICTLDQIKTRLEIELAETKYDSLFTAFAGIVLARFEAHTRRKLSYLAAETMVVGGDSIHLVPARLPVYSVASWEVKEDEATGWVTKTDVSYLIRDESNIVLLSPLATYLQSLRITYAGGFTMPTDEAVTGVQALPEELTSCALEEVAQLWQHRDKLGISMEWSPGVAGSQFRKLDLLPNTTEILSRYRRFVL